MDILHYMVYFHGWNILKIKRKYRNKQTLQHSSTCSLSHVIGRFPKEEAGGLCEDTRGTSADPADGAALWSDTGEVERSSCYQRSGYHLPGCAL